MKKFFTLFLSIILCALCLFSFSACDDKTISSEDIINPRTKNIRVGYVEYAPLNYMYKDKFTGYNTKLAVSVFNTLGYNVEFVLVEPTDDDRRVVNQNDVYQAFNNDEIDCFWGGISDAVLNDDSKFDFSYKYMENSPCLVIVNGHSQINSIDDFNGKTVAFGRDSSGQKYCNDYLVGRINGIDFKNCPKGQSSALHNANSYIEDANCAIVDTLFAYYHLEKTNEYSNLTLNSTKTHPANYQIEQKNYLRVVFKKNLTGTNELRDNVNKTLEFFANLKQNTIDYGEVSLLEAPAIGISFTNADLKDFLITDFSNQKK